MTKPHQAQAASKTAKRSPNGPAAAQPSRPATTSKRAAVPSTGGLSASAKQRRIAEMLHDIRSGIQQLSSNADILRGRFS